MGLAASQARLMMLYARKSDLEYQIQNITQRKLAMTYESQTISNKYTEAISNKRLTVKIPDSDGSGDQEYRLTTQTLFNAAGLILCSRSANNGQGAVVGFTGNMTDGFEPITDTSDEGWLHPDLIEARLRSGDFYLCTIGKDEEDNTPILTETDWRTHSQVIDDYNEDDDEMATAEYEADSLAVQNQDKRLDMQLKNLETQHKAIETETDSVKKVIDKNIEKSFKTLG